VVADHDGNATANKKLKLPENEFRTELRRAAVLGNFTGWMTPRRSAVEVCFRKGHTLFQENFCNKLSVSPAEREEAVGLLPHVAACALEALLLLTILAVVDRR
jgi:hypothetical protein